ncbi:alanine--tRNA ligase-related protein [Shigella flexneri]
MTTATTSGVALRVSAEEDGDRYIEIWNIVLMQFNRQADGTMNRRRSRRGYRYGSERITAVPQHAVSNYDIDLFL